MNKTKARRFLKTYKSLMILAAIVILAFVLSGGRSLTAANLQNLMLQVSIQGIVGFGMTFTLLCGEFDLSVGSVLTLCGIVFAKCVGVMHFPFAVLAALFTGVLLGLINGILVSGMGLSSFIGTLGSSYVFKGIAELISNGKPTSVSGSEFAVAVSRFKIAGFAVFPYLFLLTGLICAYILMYTRFGRNIYATGGNYEVAKNTGIRVKFYKMMSFVIVCTLAAAAGILLTIRLQSATPIAGENLNLLVISSIIIGGTSTTGGVGNIQMSLIGLFIVGVLTNTLDLLGVSGYYQQVVQGLLTVTVIGTASYTNYRNTSAV